MKATTRLDSTRRKALVDTLHLFPDLVGQPLVRVLDWSLIIFKGTSVASAPEPEITQLLQAWEKGDETALEKLAPESSK